MRFEEEEREEMVRKEKMGGGMNKRKRGVEGDGAFEFPPRKSGLVIITLCSCQLPLIALELALRKNNDTTLGHT